MAKPKYISAAGIKLSIDEPIQVFGVTQQDLDGDGIPEKTVIDCSFANEQDQVLVFDQNEDMPTGTQWEAVTDFKNDVWVFDASADGSAQLIIDFDMQNGQFVALLYDDVNGDNQVSYHVEDNKISIDESNYWHVKVVTDHPWTQPGGLYDTKVTFLIDGTRVADSKGSQVTKNDGVVDSLIDIGDRDGDGINDYSFSKDTIRSQAVAHKPAPYENIVFWPLLVGIHNYEEYRYFDHPPVVSVDWSLGTIDRTGILGYPIEAGYHIYSWLPLDKGKTNQANFENPMGYYDMAADQDGWPELQVRFRTAVSHDPNFPFWPYQGTIDTPNVEVNYSWDENNDNYWDYKFNVSSNYSIDQIVQFPDFAVKSIPYEEIIPWVKNNNWDVAMLVFDSHPSPDSEGMYGKGWMINRGYRNGESIEPSGLNDQYMTGLSDQPPIYNYQDIQNYMRGEYNFHYFNIPKIYLSSVDRQLHLYSAESGVWNLGDDRRIRYQNLDEDEYIDQWQYFIGDTLVQQMNQAKGSLVVSGLYQVAIKRTDISYSLLETQPPGDHEEWLKLDKQLEMNTSDLAPEDFPGMLKQVSGEELKITNASLRGYRMTDTGFRFVLSLDSEFSFEGEDWLGLGSLSAGEYLVSYDGNFNIFSLTSPAIAVQFDSAIPIDAPATQFINQDIQVTLKNEGLEDANEVQVSIGSSLAGGETTWQTPQTVNVLAGGMIPLTLHWTPQYAGKWLIEVRAEVIDPKQEGNANSQKLEITVRPAQGTSLRDEMSAFGLVKPWQVMLLLLSVLAVAGTGVFILSHEMSKEAKLQDHIDIKQQDGDKRW